MSLWVLHTFRILCSSKGHQIPQIWNYRQWVLKIEPWASWRTVSDLISELSLQPLNFIHIIYFDNLFLPQLFPDSPQHPNFNVCVHTWPSHAVSNLFWECSFLMTKPSLQPGSFFSFQLLVVKSLQVGHPSSHGREKSFMMSSVVFPSLGHKVPLMDTKPCCFVCRVLFRCLPKLCYH